MAKKNGIENATKVLNDLEAKADALVQARADDAAEMAALAYAAHTGDQRAEERLETLQGRAIKLDLEARNLDIAIMEARKRVAAAQNDERNAEEMKVAEELLELSQIMREAGAKADKGLKMLAEGLNDLRKIIIATQQRGLNNPSAQQLQSLGRRAVLGAMIDTPLAKEFEHISPADQKNLAAFTAAWADAIEKIANTKLGGDAESAA